MPDGFALAAAVMALGLVPFLWSGLIALAHRGHPGGYRAETGVLAIMLIPAFVAIALLAWCGLVAVPQAAVAVTVRFEPLLLPAVPATSPVPVDGLRIAVLALAAAYLFGAGWHVWALLAAQRRYGQLAASAVPHPDMHGVLVTGMEIPAFADWQRRIVVSQRIAAVLEPHELALIVAHERAHVGRGDPLHYAVLAWIDAVFWFNPFVRAQTRKCRLAAEVACDAAVVAAAPSMRKTYAATIVAVLRHAAGDALACTPAAISPRNLGDHGMRIREIMTPSPHCGKRVRAAFVVAAVLAVPAGALQLAYAEAASGDAPFAVLPLHGRISASYGEMRDPFTGKVRFHNGVDIVGKLGADIVAPAAGRAVHVLHNDGVYGNVLEIEHDNGLVTRYSHLQNIEVAEGERIMAGQLIARVGSTGRSTGPHLDLQVLQGGKPINPAEVFNLK
jgi:Zn-dependent protease with chaperone function